MKTIPELEQENADLRALVERLKGELTKALQAVADYRKKEVPPVIKRRHA